MSNRRTTTISLTALACLTLAACSPGVLPIDNPKDGDVAHLSAGQALTVRWSDPSSTRDWILVTPPTGVVKSVSETAKAATNAPTGLQVFEFVGAKTGEERLTFTYHAKDGPADPAEDTATLLVKVG